MIVRNEGDHLRRCLESVTSMVDAIHITDTGSSDNTLEIASGFGAEVRQFPWIDDFSAARNHSITNVEQDWILVLDADDFFPEGEGKKIREAISATDHTALTVHYEIMPGHTPEPGLKLFRNHLGIRYEGLIHESIRNSLAAVPDATIGATDTRLFHAGYETENLPGKVARNLPMLRKEYERASQAGDRMQRLSVGVDLANSLIAAGDTATGVAELKALLDDMITNGAPGDGRWELSALVYLLWFHFEQQQFEVALALCEASAGIFGGHPVFPLYRGMALLRANRFKDALKDFQQFEKEIAKGAPPLSVPVVYVGPELFNMAGQCCLSLNQAAHAEDYFRKALELEPGNPEFAVKLKLASLRSATPAEPSNNN